MGGAGAVQARAVPAGRPARQARALPAVRRGPPLLHGLQDGTAALVRDRERAAAGLQHPAGPEGELQGPGRVARRTDDEHLQVPVREALSASGKRSIYYLNVLKKTTCDLFNDIRRPRRPHLPVAAVILYYFVTIMIDDIFIPILP